MTIIVTQRSTPIFVLAALVLGSASPPAMAEKRQACTVELATGQVGVQMLNKTADQGTAMEPLLVELDKLNDVAKDRPKEAVRFGRLNQQVLALMLAQIVDSAHARDAHIVHDMWAIAKKAYADRNFVPTESDPAGMAWAVMRVNLPRGGRLSDPQVEGCSIDRGLALVEAETDKRLAKYDPVIAKFKAVTDRLKAKYGGLDPGRMSSEDAATARRVADELEPGYREKDLLVDIQNIRAWYRMADFVYQTRLDDLSTYGPSTKSIGKTLQAKLPTFDERQKLMVEIWLKLDQLVKDELQKNMEMLLPRFESLDPGK